MLCSCQILTRFTQTKERRRARIQWETTAWHMTSVVPAPQNKASSSCVKAVGFPTGLWNGFRSRRISVVSGIPNSFAASRFEAPSWTANMALRNCSLVNRFFLFQGIHVRHNRQRITKNRTLLSKLLKTASLVDVFSGGGAIYVMFQAVISHCIILPTFSRAWMNCFPVGELH